MALEIGIILSQILDFLDEVVLMCFGMRLVDAFKFACRTSTANIWSSPITLEKEKASPQVSSRSNKDVCVMCMPLLCRRHRVACHGRLIPSAWPFCKEYRQ